MHDMSKKAYYLWAVAIAAIVFYLYYDFSILWPENINWLLSARHDWGQHYLGWAFYRDEPWYFPIGTIKDYIYPVSTNIGFTDSIPLLAIPLKFLSPLLPEDFQYIGIWMFLCYVMTAFYSLKIFRLYNIRPIFAILATLLITGNPVLWFRGMHPALCAHGFIIASIYFYLKPATKENVTVINRNQVILTCITSVVHPYLFAMVVGFNFILPLRQYYYEKVLSFKKALVYPVFCCAISLSVWVIVGLIKIGPSESLVAGNSYGLYVFNLNSLYNSSGFSSLFPAVATDGSPFSYESFMYLGLGMGMLITGLLLYGSVSGKLLSFFKKNKFLYPLFALAGFMVLFAITNRITFNDSVLFEIPLPQALLKIGSIFRASSRFFWVAYYLILFFFLLFFMKQRMEPAATIILLLTITGLQAYDLRPLIHGRNLPPGTYNSPLNEKKWKSIIKDYDRIITYPPFQNHLLSNMDYQDLSFLAVKNNVAISIGYTARDNIRKNNQYTDSLTHSINNGILRDNELYITSPEHLERFSALFHNNKSSLDYLDGYYLVYSKRVPRKTYFEYNQAEKNKLDSIAALYSQTGIIKEIKIKDYSDRIMSDVEDITFENKTLRIKGWAFLKGKNNIQGDSVFVTVSNESENYLGRTIKIKRPDVTASFKADDLEDSGFSATIFTEDFKTDNIIIGLSIKSKDGEWEHVLLGHVKEMVNPIPEKIKNLPRTFKNQKGNLDSVVEQEREIFINGWSVFDDRDAIDNIIKIVLSGDKGDYVIKTKKTLRRDVTTAFKNKYNFDDSGFKVKIIKNSLPPGDYKAGILLMNTNTNEQSYLETDKIIEIQ